MVPVRLVSGVVTLALSAFLIRAAMQRLMLGLATMFGAAVALAMSVLLIGGSAWSALRRWRSYAQSQEADS